MAVVTCLALTWVRGVTDLNLVNKERSMERHNSKETRTLQPIRRNMEENDKLDLFDKEIEKDSVVKVVNRKEKQKKLMKD